MTNLVSFQTNARWIIIGISFLAMSFASSAQNVLTGIVVDSESGEPLIGATVKETNTTNGVITGLDGDFRLSMTGNSITISYVGYTAQVIDVQGRINITINLVQDASELEEVVVIGYGEQTKKVATASISSVSSKDLEGFSVPNVGNMLQGQVSGAVIMNSSGSPGSAPTILLRGVGTNGDPSPLLIIDGIIFDNTGPLNGLNPDDIENINILKDGASTAIYGARGANGVIIVTTKGASEGQSSLSYGYTYGEQQAWKVPDVLNKAQYVELISEKYTNAGLTPPAEVTNPTCSTCDTDWMDRLFRKGYTTQHNFSYSKGSPGNSLRASLSIFRNQGTIAPKQNNYRRITARVNREHKINDYIKMGQNLQYTRSEFRGVGEDNAFGGSIASAFVYDPLTPVFDANTQFGFGQSRLVLKEYINPFVYHVLDNDKGNLDEAYGNAYIEITPTSDITVKSDIGFTKSFWTDGGYTPAYEPLHIENNGNELNDVWANANQNGKWIWTNTARYNKSFGPHKVDGLIGYAMERNNIGKGVGGSGQNLDEEFFATDAFRFIQWAPDDSLTRAYNFKNTTHSIQSQFARMIYSFDDKYLFTFIIRRDGSDRFGANNRYGIFPSVSAGWVATSEDFWPLPIVNFFKLRVSYGENGNDRIGANNFRSVIVGGSNYQFGSGASEGVYQGLTTNRLSNPDLKWETSQQIDIGFEAGLMEDKITLEVDYYKKTTVDLLGDGIRFAGSGADPSIVNVGSVENSGIEVELGYRENISGIDFRANLTVTTLKNEVTKVSEVNSFINGAGWPVRNFAITRMEVGEPIGYFRGYRSSGIFQSQNEVFAHIGPTGDPIQPNAQPGDLRFEDINNDGILDDNDVVKIGNPWADLTMGLRLSASYKGFTLSSTLFTSLGSEIYRIYERQDVTNNNYQVEWLDRWTPENPGNTYPRVTSQDINQNQRPSDFYVESGDYLRMKSLQLSYTVPNSITEKIKMSNLRIFVMGDNLFTLTGYTGFDPEVGFGGTLGTNIDNGTYPLNRTISFGFTSTF